MQDFFFFANRVRTRRPRKLNLTRCGNISPQARRELSPGAGLSSRRSSSPPLVEKCFRPSFCFHCCSHHLVSAPPHHLPRIDVGDESSVKSDPRRVAVTRLGARQRLRHVYAEVETLLEMRRVCDQSSVLPHVSPPTVISLFIPAR